MRHTIRTAVVAAFAAAALAPAAQAGATTTMTPNPQTTGCSVDGGTQWPSVVQGSGTYTSSACSIGQTRGTLRIDVGGNGTWDVSSATFTHSWAGWSGPLFVDDVDGHPETGPEPDGSLSMGPLGACTGGSSAFTVSGRISITW